jgi:hypothetical protein
VSLIKITSADRWFSLCVRERSDWHCERCGRRKAIGPGLHCSHFYGRSARSTRYHADNAFAHCMGCHQHLGSHPELFREWVLEQLGEARFEMLRERFNMVFKWRPKMEREVAAFYKIQHALMLRLRADGVTGRMEFASWQ